MLNLSPEHFYSLLQRISVKCYQVEKLRIQRLAQMMKMLKPASGIYTEIYKTLEYEVYFETQVMTLNSAINMKLSNCAQYYRPIFFDM